jgi:hypothetical protein
MTHDHPQPVRRMKTYTGSQGYVYQYYFVGKRQSDRRTTEFIFDVTADRKTMFSVSVFLALQTAAQWSAAHGRPLNDAEQYAAVKLRLFQAFDEIEDMLRNGRSLQLDSTALDQLLSTLGVE